MKTTALLLFVILGTAQVLGAANADTTHRSHRRHHTTSHHTTTHHTTAKHTKPKNEISKLAQDRKTNHTVRQITPDPHKSPGKHADNLSKNVNHEANRESKDVNKTVNKASKDINHTLSGK
ncbi:MAG TPA: hypothetical protein VKU00_18885 [Chthonomonadaceae bacterium]|nr:hypothetical protein [Chthonomonadaceae bacterium]